MRKQQPRRQKTGNGQVERFVKAGRQADHTTGTFLSISKSIPFIAFSSTSVTEYVYSPGANVTFELNESSEISSFATLFDEFRVISADVCMTWMPPTSSNYISTTAVLYYAQDRDGGTVPTSFDEIQQRGTVTRTNLSWRAPTVVWFRNQQCAYADSDGRVISSNRWHDLADAQSVTFCVGTTGMLKRASSPSGISDRVCVNIRPVVVFRRRR